MKDGKRKRVKRKTAYQPAYTISKKLLNKVAETSEAVGRYAALAELQLTPHLRRKNRIRTIQASLAIENNTLTLEQVTDVLEGKPVKGSAREILEVKNAFAAYEAMETWHPASETNLLEAHRLLMEGLVAHPGQFRKEGVGIFRGPNLVHMAPPPSRVPYLMQDLLGWLAQTDEHPLVASCLFHYELEFIHPFMDGNGRMGRLWQTLILHQWHPSLAFAPIETLVRDRQEGYYQALGESDRLAEGTPFAEFMLDAIFETITSYKKTDQVTDQVNNFILQVLQALKQSPLGSSELMAELALNHRPTFRKNYLDPSLAGSWIERTQPEAPKSPTQRYRLTEKGRKLLGNR